jgi:hypothetical protein
VLWADLLSSTTMRFNLFVDQSTFLSVTVEELLDADVLPAQTAAVLRARYILG